MNSTASSHLPFAQLPPEARALFFILMMTVYGPELPATEKVFEDLEMIWNTERLTLDDFQNDERLNQVFEKYARVFRKDAWWLDSIGVSREDAERAGFFEWRRRRAQYRCMGLRSRLESPVPIVTGSCAARRVESGRRTRCWLPLSSCQR